MEELYGAFSYKIDELDSPQYPYCLLENRMEDILKVLTYQSLSRFMTLAEFQEFCRTYPGYRLPGRKESIRSLKAQFMKPDYQFDGNVPALAKKLGVTRQAVYSWEREKLQNNNIRTQDPAHIQPKRRRK
jgi:hypothetical protein